MNLRFQWNRGYEIVGNFGESPLSRTQVFEWHKALSEGRIVIYIVLENRGFGNKEIPEDLLWIDSTQLGLGMKRVRARFVSKYRNLLQK